MRLYHWFVDDHNHFLINDSLRSDTRRLHRYQSSLEICGYRRKQGCTMHPQGRKIKKNIGGGPNSRGQFEPVCSLTVTHPRGWQTIEKGRQNMRNNRGGSDKDSNWHFFLPTSSLDYTSKCTPQHKSWLCLCPWDTDFAVQSFISCSTRHLLGLLWRPFQSTDCQQRQIMYPQQNCNERTPLLA